MKQKNLIIIMADQLRYDFAFAETPNIDALREDSVEFTNAYTACPLCIPARGSFFTGRYPNETGCLINPFGKEDKEYGYVDDRSINLYEWLEQQFDVWHIGKQHFYTVSNIDKKPGTKVHWTYTQPDYRKYLSEHGKEAPGGMEYRGVLPQLYQESFTHLAEYSSPATGLFEPGFGFYYDGYFLKGALEAIDHRDKEKPFCLSGMFIAPHPPFQIPDPWYSMYEGGDLELPDNVGRWCKDQSPLQIYNITGALGMRYYQDDWRRIWNVYRGLVTLLDECVGQLIAALKREGLYEDTVIVFTSDHGEMLGSHGLWQKMCMYEESVKTPLYIKLAGSNRTKRIKTSEALINTIDLFPTICDLLDIETPDTVTGCSFADIINGNREEHRTEIHIQFDGNGGLGNTQRCIIQDGKKLIIDIYKDEIYLELYDIKTDAQEMHNLAFSEIHRGDCQRLIENMNQHMLETGDRLGAFPAHTYDTFIQSYGGRRREEDLVLVRK